MKSLLSIPKKWLGLLVAGGITVVAAAVAVGVFLMNSEEAYRQIQVYQTEGTTIVEREGNSMEAYKNMQLISDDILETGKESYTHLKLDSDKYILMEPDTEIHLEATGNSVDSKTKIYLDKGAIVNQIDNPLSENSEYQVTTPNSTMAVRGTKFRVEVTYDENGVSYTTVSVYEGSVECRLVFPDGTIDSAVVVLEKEQEVKIWGDQSDSDYVGIGEVTYGELREKVLEFLGIKLEDITPTPSVTPTEEPTPSETPTEEPTPSVTPTEEPIPSVTPTPTEEPIPTPSVEPTQTPIPTVRPTQKPSTTPTPTQVPTMVPTEEPVPTPSATVTPTPTATPSASATPTPTATPSASATPTPTATPSASATPTPTATPSVTVTPTPTATPSAMVTPTPTATPSATVTPTPTVTPTVTPTPTPEVTTETKNVNVVFYVLGQTYTTQSAETTVTTTKEVDSGNTTVTYSDITITKPSNSPVTAGYWMENENADQNTDAFIDGDTLTLAITSLDEVMFTWSSTESPIPSEDQNIAIKYLDHKNNVFANSSVVTTKETTKDVITGAITVTYTDITIQKPTIQPTLAGYWVGNWSGADSSDVFSTKNSVTVSIESTAEISLTWVATVIEEEQTISITFLQPDGSSVFATTSAVTTKTTDNTSGTTPEITYDTIVVKKPTVQPTKYGYWYLEDQSEDVFKSNASATISISGENIKFTWYETQ